MTAQTADRQPKGIPAGGQFAAMTHSDEVTALVPGPIESLAFNHDGERFEIELDAPGRYTVYAADNEGDEVSSFTHDGDPADQAGLEAAAALSLTQQRDRLAEVASPGTLVTWTDPDGGEQHSGKVVSAKGEIITLALRSGGEAEVFGNELTVDEDATGLHRATLAAVDTPVFRTDPATGIASRGRTLGPAGEDTFCFQDATTGSLEIVRSRELERAPDEPPAPRVKPVETQRRIRGHNFYAPKAVLAKVPALRSTEDVPFEEKRFHLHYFTGGADWYIAELDQDTGKAFGLMNPSGGDGYWGYVDLAQLEAVNLGGYRVVERDMHFSQGNLAHVSRHR